MLIEGLGSVTFVNGILRVQTIGVAANGEAVDISDKIGGDNDDSSSKSKSKSGAKKNKKK